MPPRQLIYSQNGNHPCVYCSPPSLGVRLKGGGHWGRTEPVFVNVYGAQEAILRTDSATQPVRPVRQIGLSNTGPPGWESIPGLLKRSTNTGSDYSHKESTFRPEPPALSWNFKKIYGARNQVGRGLSYRPARLHRLAEFIPWNRFLGSINV